MGTDAPARRSRNHSLSSIRWRRVPRRGGSFMIYCPSPRSSLHSFVAGRGRKSAFPNLWRKCANLRGCGTDSTSCERRSDHRPGEPLGPRESVMTCAIIMHKSLLSLRKSFETRASSNHLLTRPLSHFLPLRPDRRDALSHFGCGFAALGPSVVPFCS